MLNKKYRTLLKQFQCEYNRNIEETFAQTFAEDDFVRLFFINENEAFTDGQNIVIDPAVNELFTNREALKKTEKYLGWPETVSNDPYAALRMITHSLNLHECLHLLYTDFPPHFVKDQEVKTKNEITTIAMISNIIEDAYIEAVGCSVYDNLEMFILFNRVSDLFVKHIDNGTVARAFNITDEQEKHITQTELNAENSVLSEDELKKINETKKKFALINYLCYMANLVLYPMVQQDEPSSDIKEYVEKTKELFHKGCYASSPTERYDICKKIFEIIKPLIPESETIDKNKQLDLFSDKKTHDGHNYTLSAKQRKGRTQVVKVRLFEDKNRNKRTPSVTLEQLVKQLKEYAKDKKVIVELELIGEGKTIERKSTEYACSPIHKNIKVNEKHPKINFNLHKAYQNIYNKYRMNINFYNSRFSQLLKANKPVKDDNHLFGLGIVSKKLGDHKKRYWYRMIDGTDIPDLGVLLLIDGSGSMSGELRHNTMISSVVLHEVLKKQSIEHAIIEHRAGGWKPEIDINVLVDFQGPDEQKLNILQIDAHGDNRDALALLWAEDYLRKNSFAENKLIIVLSDGYPAHTADNYFPPVSTKDTANTVKKIIHRGTNIIGIALDSKDSLECYDALKEIYPNLISCNEIKRLTGQLLSLISKQLM